MNTADFFVERLKTWGVKRIFGYSGDGINGVIGALQHDGGIDFIQPRHEEMAAFRPSLMRSSPASSASAWRPADPERPT